MKKILHFSSSNQGIRFLKPIKKILRDNFGQDIYQDFRIISDFKKKLLERKGYFDLALISSHGNPDSILLKQPRYSGGDYYKVLTNDDVHLFKHDFVLAISCSTAKEFGPRVCEEALVYIGFDNYISNDFEFKSRDNRRFYNMIQKIFKRIYIEVISEALIEFVEKCMTVKAFYQYINLKFRFKINHLMKMDIKDLRNYYSIPLNEKDQEILHTMTLEFLHKFKSLNNKLKVIGEEYYICWYFIDKLTNIELVNLLDTIENISKKNSYYKYFIKALIYLKLEMFEYCYEMLELMKTSLDDESKETPILKIFEQDQKFA